MEQVEAEAMLRQLIGHFQELYDVFGSNPTTTTTAAAPCLFSSTSASNHHRNQLLSHPYARWFFLNLDDKYTKDSCTDVIMSSGKSNDSKMIEAHKLPAAKRSRKERCRGKRTAQTNICEVLDQHIWKEFPEDLLEGVIARLPIDSFFRFRSVCRKWDCLLNSHSFSQQCSQVPQAKPWFYTITHESVNAGAIYDPSAKKWRHPAIPSLPPKVILLPAASAGGLVCFVDIGHRHFYVCNPLTQTWKELPARTVEVWSRVALGMVLNGNSTSSGYKILWVGRDGEFEVYDSIDNSWTRPGNMPQNIKLPLSLNLRSHAVSMKSSVYFMRSDPEGIVSYDMNTGIWKQYLIPFPLNSTDHTLAICGGRIMLVGLLTKNAATCVCIWELQKMTLLWKEVDRMPNVWCLEFYGKHVRMTCLGNDVLFMLSLKSRQMNRIVSYDVERREWLKVPGCVPRSGRKRQWIACGTAFYPSLTAVP